MNTYTPAKRRYYQANKEKWRQWTQQSRTNNREHFNANQREYRRRNPAMVKEQRRRYYLKDKANRLANGLDYYKNPEQRERMRKYRLEHREKAKVTIKKWMKENQGRFASYGAARRARKRALTVGELTGIQKIYERAKELRQWFYVVVDHIIPLSKGGTHEVSNLQIIYEFENRRKRSRLDYKPAVVFL
jgi:5-methylcytosine-specific restriction endonuclease McrA